MKIVKIVLLYLIMPVILLIGSLLYFITTETGIKTLVAVVPKLVPFITIEEVSGNWQNLRIGAIGVTPQGVAVNVKNIELSVNPSCLRDLNLCLNRLNAGSVSVDVDTQALPESDPTPLTHINLPLEISLDELNLSQIAVSIDGVDIELDQLKGKAAWRETLTVDLLDLSDMKIAVNEKMPLHNNLIEAETEIEPIKLESHTTLETQIENVQKLLQKPLLGQLPNILIPIDLTIPKFNLNRLTLVSAPYELQAENLRIDVSSLAEKVTLKQLTTEISLCEEKDATTTLCVANQVNLKSEIEMKDKWPVTLDLSLGKIKDDGLFITQGILLKDKSLELNLSGNVNDLLSAEVKIKEADSLWLTSSVSVNPNVAPMSFDVKAHAHQLAWPMARIELEESDESISQPQAVNEPDVTKSSATTPDDTKQQKSIEPNAYSIAKFELAATGTVNDYLIDLSSDFAFPNLPNSQIKVQAHGTLNQFILDTLNLATLEPVNKSAISTESINLSGNLNFEKGISWLATLETLNTTYINQENDLNIVLTGGMTTTGKLQTGVWDFSVSEMNLDGLINQYKLNLKGQVQGNSEQIWQIDDLIATLGENSLSLSGVMADELDMNLTINAPRLQGIIPQLAGRVIGNAKLSGTITHPQATADIDISQFRFGDVAVRNAALKSSIATENQISGSIVLTGSGISIPSGSFNTLSLDIRGNEESHSIALNANGQPISAAINIKGAFDRNSLLWRAAVNQSQFLTSEGNVTLERPFVAQLSPEVVSVEPHCWMHEAGRLCLSETFELQEESRLLVGLERLNLNFLNRYMGESTQLNGMVNGQLELFIPADRNISGELTLAGQSINVMQLADNAWLKAEFDTAQIKSVIKNNQLDLDWAFSIKNNGSLNGDVVINDVTGNRTLNGQMALRDFNLNLLQPLFAQNEVISGAISSQLSFSGNVQKPLINGEFNLDDLKVVSYRIPFDITDSNLKIVFRGQQSTMSGQIITPDGSIVLDGQANWQNPSNWQTILNANSNRLKIAIPPMAQIELQPSLTFDANKERMLLTGNVNIPWARIQVDALPEAVVEVSNDQVFLDEDLQPLEQVASGLPIKANLNIILGNDIQLNAFGLIATLTGGLNVVQSEQGTSIFGEINTPTGRFRAYGQDLILRKGVITFAGTPDRPKLNVEAIRNPQNIDNDVVAGVRVTGFADDPRIELFSIPAMAQEEILSYILRGQGLDVAGADSGLMTSMLIGLGTAQSGQLIGTIGETFGVKNLSLDTQGSGDNSQVVVSGDIFPGLQVRYGVGIFDSLATITLRYQLMPRLYLEAVSGLDQAIDLLYQFEFN